MQNKLDGAAKALQLYPSSDGPPHAPLLRTEFIWWSGLAAKADFGLSIADGCLMILFTLLVSHGVWLGARARRDPDPSWRVVSGS